MCRSKKIIAFQILIYSIFITPFCLGQQLLLKGQILIHNSKHETGNIKYIGNAQIVADFTTPAVSDDNGNFALTFVGLEKGISVDLKVEKSGWEVVNKRELHDVVVGRKVPLKVFLARKGKLAQAQAELYNVSVKTLTKNYDKLIKKLKKEGNESKKLIQSLEEKLNVKIHNRLEAEQLLKEQLTTTKKKLPKFAKELAATNLDFASEMYIKAYQYFKNGEIEKAIGILDEAVLDRQAEEAIGNIDSLEFYLNVLDSTKLTELKNLDYKLESISLKARAYTQQHRYPEAIAHYQKAIALMMTMGEINQIKLLPIKKELIAVLNQYGQQLREENKFSEALITYEQLRELSPADKEIQQIILELKKKI